jgi:hypothetical protein
VSEHLLPPNDLLDYRLPRYASAIDLVLKPLIGARAG